MASRRSAARVDHERGDMLGDRSRTDFAGSRSRKARRGIAPERQQPRPPPIGILSDLLADPQEMPTPIFGQYPTGLIARLLPWLRCERHEVLHVCSGALPPGEGIRVDIRPEARPDYVADGRKLPFGAGTAAAVMIDPPYAAKYARDLYGVEYPRPSHLLAEAARVVRRGGRIVFVHYIVPKPARGTRLIKVFGLSTGFNYPIRALSVFERDQPEMAL